MTDDVTDEHMKLEFHDSSQKNSGEKSNIKFLAAAKMCETSANSSLQDFYPLEENEPNLEFDMTNANKDMDLHVKLVQDAKNGCW